MREKAAVEFWQFVEVGVGIFFELFLVGNGDERGVRGIVTSKKSSGEGGRRLAGVEVENGWVHQGEGVMEEWIGLLQVHHHDILEGETSEALHWTQQQQQKIDMDPELYTPKIEDIVTAVIEMYGDI
ncbi:hypothetical protein LAZ67_1004965 [Cordylochernes scorpioides]|uniref:Uncharacterized protein n=1 Tax=Cordylochernes scorpioides TaxID=51811 RepID=A0ABY6JZL4_9ARAC|nr:hypothetical protein LAZ67_1004965 [Cordylochernes scorpioides]